MTLANFGEHNPNALELYPKGTKARVAAMDVELHALRAQVVDLMAERDDLRSVVRACVAHRRAELAYDAAWASGDDRSPVDAAEVVCARDEGRKAALDALLAETPGWGMG